ncbi:hypothetical protein ACTP13_25105 [Paenibacillus peoriae]
MTELFRIVSGGVMGLYDDEEVALILNATPRQRAEAAYITLSSRD